MLAAFVKRFKSIVSGRFGAVSVVGLSFLVAGCASLPAPINYSPSSSMTATGTLKVGNFRYLPAIKGKVAPNQLRNTALGDIKLDKNIDTYYRNAVFKELRFVGVNVNGTTPVLTGDINDYLVDDLGYSVDWTVDVTYVLHDAATGKIVYSAEKVTKSKTAKFLNAFQTINEQIRLNIEALLKDPAFIKAIN